MADGWRERNVWYPGRPVRNALKEVTTVQGNEAVLNVQESAEVIVSRKVKDRISRSLKYNRESVKRRIVSGANGTL